MTPLFDNNDITELSEFIDDDFINEVSNEVSNENEYTFDSKSSPILEFETIILNSSISLSERFQTFQKMYQSPYINKQERCIRVLLLILEDETISKEERFSWLTRLKLSSDSLHVCLYGYVYWFYNQEEPLLYKMLSAQFLLSHPVDNYPFIKTHMKFCQQWLYQISKKHSDIQVRSEAADMLLRLGTPNFRKASETTIHELGTEYIPARNRTFYTHNQNIHDIQQSKEAILSLMKTPVTITLDSILEWLTEMKNEDASSSFQRIIMDTAIYEGFRMTDILSAIVQKIRSSEYRVELEKRLLEELTEMKGWCSTGHIVRLLNTLQGFDSSVFISISVRDEIRSTVFSRLNYRMKTCSLNYKMN